MELQYGVWSIKVMRRFVEPDKTVRYRPYTQNARMAELAYATALEPVQLKVRIFLWAHWK